jgi:hypothetical protein
VELAKSASGGSRVARSAAASGDDLAADHVLHLHAELRRIGCTNSIAFPALRLKRELGDFYTTNNSSTDDTDYDVFLPSIVLTGRVAF